jgi:hypothetical protein
VSVSSQCVLEKRWQNFLMSPEYQATSPELRDHCVRWLKWLIHQQHM